MDVPVGASTMDRTRQAWKRGSMLDAIVRGSESSDVAVVLCHGFGADAADLASLAGGLDPGEHAYYVFPNAPHLLPHGWGAGRAWFPEEPGEIVSFATGELFRKLALLDPPGLEASGAMLAETVNDAAAGRRLILGGFSQGAMVACEAVLSGGLRPDALLVFSGALIAERRWTDLIAAGSSPFAGLPVIQSHGRLDSVLPFDAGVALGTLLDRGGAERTFFEFNGDHGIPPQLLPAVTDRLADLLASPR